jgi:hypothetical protein
MVDLILKKDDKYYASLEYSIDPKTYIVYKNSSGRIMKTYTPNGKQYEYQFIKGQYYRKDRIIQWVNDYLEGKIEIILNQNIDTTRRCIKCYTTSQDFISNRGRICNKCLIKRKENFLTDNYKIADKFLYKLKAKKWQATYLDLFELINIYDIYYPSLVIGQLNEDTANKLLLRIIKKHKKVRAGLIKI